MKMKRMTLGLAALTLLSGCATSSMKSTSPDSDSERGEHCIFPLYWGDGHIDFFPLVWWRFDKSFTLFPLAWWKKDQYFNIFPLWWSDNNHKLFIPLYYQDENSIHVIPFYGKISHLDNFTEWYGPYGLHRDTRSPENDYNWCLPFYYRDVTSFETMLFGWDRNDRSSWVLPFYYKDYNDFVSLPWISGQDKDLSWRIVPPLLSWVTSLDKREKKMRFLLGIVSVETKTNGYSKISILWRLFRNEYDPKTDKRSVDFLFIPVWR